MLQEPMHQTKDDKPQCQATTKKGTRAFCVIFLLLLLLLLCAFHVLRSIDRARLITNPRVCFNEVFPAGRYTKTAFRFCARARSFLRRCRSHRLAALGDVCLCIYVPQATSASAQPRKAPNIARNTPEAPSKEERGAFRSFREKTKKTRERDTAFFCASREMHKIRERERERERETFITKRERRALTERARVTSERES